MARHILVAFDLDEGSQRALERGLQLAEHWSARLTCLHVLDERGPDSLVREEARLAEAQMQAAVPTKLRQSGRVVLRVERGAVEERLLQAASDCQAEIIVTGAPRRRSLAGLFLGSTIERLLRYGSTPVLVVRRPGGSPYRRLCLALDDSPTSAYALERVRELGFAEEKTSIWAVHALQEPGRSLMTHAGIEQDAIAERSLRARSDAAARIESLLNAAKLSHAASSLIVQQKDPVSLVQEAVAEFDIDLLIVGTRGSSGIKRLLLGSTAEALIAEAECDVLAISSAE